MDVASLSDLVATTGGTLYTYTPFNPVMDHDQVRTMLVGQGRLALWGLCTLKPPDCRQQAPCKARPLAAHAP